MKEKQTQKSSIKVFKNSIFRGNTKELHSNSVSSGCFMWRESYKCIPVEK